MSGQASGEEGLPEEEEGAPEVTEQSMATAADSESHKDENGSGEEDGQAPAVAPEEQQEKEEVGAVFHDALASPSASNDAPDGGLREEGSTAEVAAVDDPAVSVEAGEGEEGGAAQEDGGEEREVGETGAGDSEAPSPNGEGQEAFDADAEEGEIIAEQIRFRQPEPGTELFVGGLTRAVTEEELRKLFSPFGELVDVRIMMDRQTNAPKGYSFIRFMTRESANKAHEAMQGHLLNGKAIVVGPSEDNRRLTISNLDLKWNKEEYRSLLQVAFKNVKGIIEMELKEETSEGLNKNTGVGYVHFESHDAAKEALAAYPGGVVLVAGRNLKLEFAKHERSASAQDKRTIYIAKLPPDVTRDELEEVFKKYGNITKLWIANLDLRTPPKGRSDYGFVAYDNDASFNEALEGARNAVIRGHRLDVSKAKQVNRSRDGSNRDGRGDGRYDRRSGVGGRAGGPSLHPTSRGAYDGPRGGVASARGVGSLAVDTGGSRPPPSDYREPYRGSRASLPPPPSTAPGYYPPAQAPPPYDDRKRRGRSAEWEDPSAKRGRMSGPPPDRGPPYGGSRDRGPPPPRDDWDRGRMGGGAGSTGPYGPAHGGGRDGYRRGPPRSDPYRGGDDHYRRPGDARDYSRGDGPVPPHGGPPPPYTDPYDQRGPPRDPYPPRDAHGRGGDYGSNHPRSPYGRDQRDRAPSPYGPAGQAPYDGAAPYGRDHHGPSQPYPDYAGGQPAPQPLPASIYYGAPPQPHPPHPLPQPPQHQPPPAPYAQQPPPQQMLQPPAPYGASPGITTGPRGPVSAGPSSLAGSLSSSSSTSSFNKPKLMPPGMSSGKLMPPGAKALASQQQQQQQQPTARPPAPAPRGPGSNGYQQPPDQQQYYGGGGYDSSSSYQQQAPPQQQGYYPPAGQGVPPPRGSHYQQGPYGGGSGSYQDWNSRNGPRR